MLMIAELKKHYNIVPLTVELKAACNGSLVITIISEFGIGDSNPVYVTILFGSLGFINVSRSDKIIMMTQTAAKTKISYL